MVDKKTFKKAFGAPLENLGLTKQGQSWYLDGRDSIVVVNLQKCDWNETYFMNIGIWLKALGEASYPKYNHCHLYYRVESFFPEKSELILVSCSLEKSNQEKLTDLSKFIKNELVPFLQNCTNENYLKGLMTNGKLNDGFVFFEAREYLSKK